MINNLATALKDLFKAFRSSSPSIKILAVAAVIFHLLFIGNLKTRFLSPLSYDMTLFRDVRGVDFNAVYMAGHYARRGQNLYTEPAYEEGIPHTRFRYTPPVAIVLGIPFSFISNFFWASRIWFVITEILLLFNIIVTIYYCPDKKAILPATLMWLFFFPYAVEIYMGQFSFLTGTLAFWAALALWQGRSRSSAALWISTILLKVFPLWMAPLYWKRTSLLKTAGILVLLLLLVLPYFAFHPEDGADFLALNSLLGKKPLSEPYMGNQGFYHFLLQWQRGLPLIPVSFSLYLSYALGALLLLVFLYLCLTGERDVRLLFCFGFTVFFVLSPEVWEHHYVMLLPFLVLGYISWKRFRRAILAAYILCALPTLYVFFNPTTGPFDAWGANLSLNSPLGYLYFVVKPAGVVIFLIVMLVQAFRKSRKGEMRP